MKVALSLTALVAGVSANTDVMKAIIDSQNMLEEQGYFRTAGSHPSVLGQESECVDGEVQVGEEVMKCDNIDFYSFLSLKDLEILDPPHNTSNGAAGLRTTDIWGWLSPTNREFSILALDNGPVVVDSTDPVNPCIIAKMPTGRQPDNWGDVKVHNDTLYHVKDTRFGDGLLGVFDYGIEVYDLLQLDQFDCSVDGWVPLNLYPQYVFPGHGRSHNVAINTESGRLYSVGTEICGRGLVILDIKQDRMKPTQIGCVFSDGYTHDVQCVNYDGPDTRYTGQEICFAYNENTLSIWDVTNAADPRMVSRTPYPNQAYAHQGWVNNDLTKVMLDDELDEVCNDDVSRSSRCRIAHQLDGTLTTSTRVFDIRNLRVPLYEGEYMHPEESIDHNLYVWGLIHRKGWGGSPAMAEGEYPNPQYAYMNNYLAGIKVVNISHYDITQWNEIGTFDTSPERTDINFAGVWSGYMHPSGVYAASAIGRGLFLLNPKMAFTGDYNPVAREGESDMGRQEL